MYYCDNKLPIFLFKKLKKSLKNMILKFIKLSANEKIKKF